jgi:hypothetical protein
MSIHDLLNRMEAAEKNFVGTQFLAPVVGDGRVAVRIAGVVCQLQVKEGRPRRFHGWAILRALSTSQAAFVRQAGLAEVAAYLRLFPAVRLVLVQPSRRFKPESSPTDDPPGGSLPGLLPAGRQWLAIPASQSDSRFRIEGPVSLLLAEEGLERFETVVARFDGRLFWYERRDPGRDPTLAAYLRDQLGRLAENNLPPKPETLHKSGLSREERDAYTLAWALHLQATRSQAELRLSEALAHAGAELRSYIERQDAYVVTYEVDGRQHVSTIHADDLSVMTAGICLAGQDHHFDLTSLVGVLRQAGQERRLVWVGEGGLPEEQYWAVHPAEED